MTDTHEIDVLLDAIAYDSNGDKLGSVNDVFINDRDGQPDFVDVNHGLFGRKNSIIPLRGHSIRNGELHLAFEKDRIKDAPDLGDEGHLSAADRDSFYRHYQVNTLEDMTRYKDGRPSQARTGHKRGIGGTDLDDSHADADRERVDAIEGEVSGDQDRPTTMSKGFSGYSGQDQMATLNEDKIGNNGTKLDEADADADRERVEAGVADDHDKQDNNAANEVYCYQKYQRP